MHTRLTASVLAPILERLSSANAGFAALYPGESDARQPVHTVYGGAHLFRAGSARRLGELASASLAEFAPGFVDLARAVGLEGSDTLPQNTAEAEELAAAIDRDPAVARREHPEAWLAHTLYQRVVEKLGREPVEDFRLDFEDGYGVRPDAEEDACAVAAAREVAAGLAAGTLPPFVGIRIKPLTAELHRRSLRTLDLFLSELLTATGGQLPPGFFVTLPKVVLPEQVTALIDVFEALEAAASLPPGALVLEFMVETPQSLFDTQGNLHLPRLAAAARGRLRGAHFGVYDYTASLTISAEHQHMSHFACDVARNLMQIAFAGTGVALSDGATNVLPVAPHRGPSLTEAEVRANHERVHAAWRLHFQHVRASLAAGYYQGWDLHPAQLPTRYAALFSFFLEGLDSAATRLATFVDKAAQATLVGDVFDDAATGQGLLNFFLRGLACGALTAEEAERSGLTREELQSRSFVKILDGRRGRAVVG